MTRDDAQKLDAADPLARFRERFEIPKGVIYLDGNSLGALPKAVPDRLAELVRREWGESLIRGWNDHAWIDAPHRIGGKIARLIGAKANEVTVADSTSVNLFKLATGALALRPGRTTILSEPGNFPTDLYILQGIERLFGGKVRIRTVAADEISGAIDADTALVVLTHAHYKTGRRHDMAAITRAAHDQGALMLWDLSHSAGILDIHLNDCGADLAVGCGYKYLNGGPGAPAFLFVAERHQGELQTPLSGWMGHAEPFAFVDDYRPAADLRRQLCGTPPILGMAALEAALDAVADAEPRLLEAKAVALGQLFIAEVEARCPELELISPRDGSKRGGHVSFAHAQGYAMIQALIAEGVIGDFRAPDVLRFGFAPLYLRYADVFDAADHLAGVVARRAYEEDRFRTRAKVT